MINLIYIDGNGRKVARPVKSREVLVEACNSEKNVENWNKYRQTGDDRYKRALVQVCYSCQVKEGGMLRGVKTVSPFFFYDIDCRDREECRQIMSQLVGRKDELGLVEVAESASYGVHAVGRREPGRTILECQVRMSMLTQTEMDTNNKENNRVVFHGPINDETTPLLDDALFTEELSDEEAAEEYRRLKEREKNGLEEVPPEAKKANKHFRTQPQTQPQTHPLPLPRGGEIQNVQWVQNEQGIQNVQRVQNEQESQTMQDVPNGRANQSPLPSGGDGGGFGGSGESNSVTRIRFIARGVMKEKGLVESDFLDEGGRHTSVKMFLSGATQLLTKEETNGVLQELMPEHWNDANIQQLVSDFYQNYTNPSQRLLKYQEELFVKSRRLAGECEGDAAAQPDPASGLGEALPRFPRLIQLLTSRTPDVYKAAVAHAVFPPLATHLCGVRFRYTDNVEHEATLMNCLMAGTGTGKGCIDKPIDHIMADIRLRDKENERREGDWKKDCQRKGANKDKMVRPEGLVIQEIDSDMTKPALVTRMDEAEGHFVYVKLNELDLFEQLRGQTGKQHFQLMCLAFDSGATYGQTRVGVQSVTARPECRFNWNACTTVLKGRRFFSRVLTDGPISRINFCTIPEQEIGSEQPVYGEYDAAFDEALKPYIDNLTSARGLIDCPQAFRLARKLQQECAEFARLSQSQTYWNLSHRACVIAWLKACVLYVANGQKWERSIEEFIRWSLRYDMSCKMLFFGADIERAEQGDEARIGRRGPRNLLELLPDEFTLDDARRVRQQQGISNEGYSAIRMIRTWVNRGYVIQNTEYSFLKSEKYKGKI